MAHIFDVVVLFNCEEIVGIIPGKGLGLLRAVKKHPSWDTVMEQANRDFDTLDELAEHFSEYKEDYDLKVEVVREVFYHMPRK